MNVYKFNVVKGEAAILTLSQDTCVKYYVKRIVPVTYRDCNGRECVNLNCVDFYCNKHKVYIGKDVNPLIIVINGSYEIDLSCGPCDLQIDLVTFDNPDINLNVCSSGGSC